MRCPVCRNRFVYCVKTLCVCPICGWETTVTPPKWLRFVAAVALVLVASSAWAQTPVVPSQAGNSKNQEVTSGTNSPVSVTLTATSATRARVYMIQARCSAGTAGITITDGATQTWSTGATEVGTTTFKQPFVPGYAGTRGNSMTITLTTCGGGNTGPLDVQADIF